MDYLLIDAVHKRKALWDSTNELHGYSNVLRKLWVEVAEELEKDVKSVRTRWKNLRAYYIKECQKINKSKRPITSTWQYFENMQFIKYTSTKMDDNDEDSNHDMPTADDHFATTESPSPAQSSNSDPNSFGTKRKRAAEDTTNFQSSEELSQYKKRKIELLENEAARRSNSDLMFFESLLPYMQIIPPVQKLSLRSKIQDIILEEVENLQNEGSQENQEVYIKKETQDSPEN